MTVCYNSTRESFDVNPFLSEIALRSFFTVKLQSCKTREKFMLSGLHVANPCTTIVSKTFRWAHHRNLKILKLLGSLSCDSSIRQLITVSFRLWILNPFKSASKSWKNSYLKLLMFRISVILEMIIFFWNVSRFYSPWRKVVWCFLTYCLCSCEVHTVIAFKLSYLHHVWKMIKRAV